MNFIAELDARGLIHDTTDREQFSARLASGPIGVYVGFDPTADYCTWGISLVKLGCAAFR